MKKGVIWYFFFGALCLIAIILIFFSDFWNNVFISPNFSLESVIIILFLALFTILAIGTIIWGKLYYFGNKEPKKSIVPKKIELGIYLGVITDEGVIIRGKSRPCSFNENLLPSMFEYSAVLYQHGDIGNIYGPFPITRKKMDEYENAFPYEEIHYISFGFQANFNSVNECLAIFLFCYPKEYDNLVITRKNRLNTLFQSIAEKNLEISSFSKEKMSHIENEVRILSFF